jgi:hypothetical protein
MAYKSLSKFAGVLPQKPHFGVDITFFDNEMGASHRGPKAYMSKEGQWSHRVVSWDIPPPFREG